MLWSAMEKQSRDPPVIKWFVDFPVRGLVSKIYAKLMQVSVGELPILKKWVRELSSEGNVINWETVWDNISHCSKNPNHQQIHFNICHRTYWTPQKRYVSKAIPTPYCTFCQPEQTGTFLHMVWECEQVHEFWNKTSIISDVKFLLTRLFYYLMTTLNYICLRDRERFG